MKVQPSDPGKNKHNNINGVQTQDQVNLTLNIVFKLF